MARRSSSGRSRASSRYGAGYGGAARRGGMRGYSKPASVDLTRHTGGGMGIKARQAGKRIGQR